MNDKVELFSHLLRFSPFWMTVDAILIVHFVISWMRSYRKTGWKIDLWYFTIFFYVFIHTLLMYPFNGSLLNMIVTEGGFYILDPFIDQAFFITIIGYLFMLVGRFLFDWLKKECPLYFFVRLFQPLSRLVEKNIQTATPLFLVLPILLFGIIIFLVAQEGNLLNPRAFFLENDALRPLYNFTHALFAVCLTYLALRSIHLRLQATKYAFFLLLILSMFLGVRAMAIWGLLTYVLYRIFANKGQFSFVKLGLSLAGILLLALYMDNFRHQQADLTTWASGAFLQTFYGNQFCNTRDFAWVLAEWNGEYALGKTYLAAVFSFLPRILSPFRQDWSVSVYTNSIVGFDSAQHAGLGLGIFGEAFLNFSYPGVILLGLIAGYALRYADLAIKQSVEQSSDIIKGYAQTLCFFFISNLFMTAGFWTFYVFLVVHLALYGWRQISHSTPKTA